MSDFFLELGSIAEFINGAAFKPEDWGETGKKIIRIQNLTDPNKPFNRTERIVSDRVQVQYGDLLVSWSATLGVFEWKDSEEALLNQHIFRVLPNEEKVNKRYLRHGLEGAIVDMQKHLHGATMKHVNRGEFLSTNLYLPPLEEQKRIAEILDRTQSLISKRKEAIELLDTLTQSIFIEMFGDPVTNPKQWKTKPLRSVCDEINDCPHSTPDWTEQGVVCLRTSNLSKGGWNWDDKRFVSEETYHERSKRGYIEANDIILSREGTVGIAAIVTPEMKICMGQRLVQVRPSSSLLTSDFALRHLLYVLAPTQISRLMVGSTSQHLNVKELRDLIIPIPPITLQQKFSEQMAVLEKLKATHRTSLTELQALFASLQHRAFRGEL